MWIPILLQQGPLDELLNNLGKLLPVIVFAGAALIPALKQARDRKKKKQETRRSLERTWERAEVEMKAAPAPKPEPTHPTQPAQPAQQALEERVRRYFEDVAGEAPTARAPREPVRAGPPAAPAPREPAKQHSLVEIDHLDSHLQHLDMHLEGLRRRPRKRLPSRVKRGRGQRPGARAEARPSAPPSHGHTLKSLLSSRATLRQAIVLREILGPPKALED